MGSVEAFYRHEHGDNPILITTDSQADALIDQALAESTEVAPVLIQAYALPDAGDELAFGVVGERGVLRYSGDHAPAGVYSTGADAGDDHLAYYYMGHWTGFPANAEVPLADIRVAVKHYVAAPGKPPAGVRWQTGPETEHLNPS